MKGIHKLQKEHYKGGMIICIQQFIHAIIYIEHLLYAGHWAHCLDHSSEKHRMSVLLDPIS
jgi:hypothetical protein